MARPVPVASCLRLAVRDERLADPGDEEQVAAADEQHVVEIGDAADPEAVDALLLEQVAVDGALRVQLAQFVLVRHVVLELAGVGAVR